MPTIKIDEKEYDLDKLSKDAKNQLACLQFVDNCQFSPQWIQNVFVVKEPGNFRRNGATLFSA